MGVAKLTDQNTVLPESKYALDARVHNNPN